MMLQLESVQLFDEYCGEKVSADRRSLAFRLVYRADDRNWWAWFPQLQSRTAFARQAAIYGSMKPSCKRD